MSPSLKTCVFFRTAAAVFFGLLLFLMSNATAAAQTPPSLPPAGEYILDSAGLFSGEDKARAQASAESVAKLDGSSLYIVTVPTIEATSSNAADDAAAYARSLYAAWKLDAPLADGSGMRILLLVVKDPGAARIELGAGSTRELEDECRRILDFVLVPRFEKNEPSRGLVNAAAALAKMVEQSTASVLPRPSPGSGAEKQRYGPVPPTTPFQTGAAPSRRVTWILLSSFLGVVGLVVLVLLIGITVAVRRARQSDASSVTRPGSTDVA